ncbi:hypothetical protein BS78_02G255800 [Paspalum vaginatum]|nr:hypothetical protein BS78_02G255800 [Paspalum vaginatum]
MRVGGGGAGEHYAGRSLLGGAPPPEASSPSFDAQRAHLERALGATTAVLLFASVSYIALTTIFGCLCAGPGTGHSQRPDEGTKRALEEIPVVVVRVRERERDDEEAAAAAECAVCLGEYAGGEEVRVLPACRHAFHRECVDRWLLARAPPTCPVCRARVAAHHEGADDAKAAACAARGAALPVGP